MFQKWIDQAAASGFKSMAAKGRLVCPECGTKPTGVPQVSGAVFACPKCGIKASLTEWSAVSTAVAKADSDTPPDGTKITRESDAAGTVVWRIPASGRSGGLMLFAVLWCTITGVVSGGFLTAFLSGGEVQGDMPDWALIPFFGVFWAVGIGMFYAACRNRFSRHTLSAGRDAVTLRRELFGRTREKSLPASGVVSVSQVEFYQQNYQPVHGIEIRGPQGKLRFGSILTTDEKAWLVADLKRVILASPAEILAGDEALPSRQSHFSFIIPQGGNQTISMAVMLTLMGGFFLFLGFRFLDDPPTRDGDGGSGFFDVISMVFDLASQGFRGIWLLMSVIMAVGGVAMMIRALRKRGMETRLEGSESEISIRVYKHGLIMEDRSFPRGDVSGIRSSGSGSSNGRPMKRVELIVGDKVEKVAWWIDGTQADALVDEARQALG